MDILERMSEVYEAELLLKKHWYYLSFADKEFRGAVVIYAHGVTDALLRMKKLGIKNPHSQVLCIQFNKETPLPARKWRNRLLTKVDVKEIWPDAKSLKEFEEE
jgi:hypothetical protein